MTLQYQNALVLFDSFIIHDNRDGPSYMIYITFQLLGFLQTREVLNSNKNERKNKMLNQLSRSIRLLPSFDFF